MRGTLYFSLLAIVGFLFSCSGKKDAPTASEGASKILSTDEQVTLESRFADYSKDMAFNKEGQVIKKDSKRSSLEGKQFTNIGGNLGDKEFAASRFSKKDWQGAKNFDSAQFKSTKNRWDQDEWFVKKHAQEAGLAARSQGQSYTTQGYGTSNAREQGGKRLQYGNDLQTEIRNRDFQGPTIMEKEDYEKMTIEESKNILGR